MANNRYNDAKASYELKVIDIRTVDESVKNYFEKKLRPTVDTPDGHRPIPVIFATGERWALSKTQQGIRDSNGTLILPLISIQRINIERNPGVFSMPLDVGTITLGHKVSSKTSVLQNNLNQRRNDGFMVPIKEKVVHEYTTVPFPEFCLMTYEVSVWTQHVGQMNEVLEKIFYMYSYADSFVIPIDYDGPSLRGRGNGRYFTAIREGDFPNESNYEEFTDTERIVRYNYLFKVNAYLILSPADKTLAHGKEREVDNERSGKFIQYIQTSSPEIKLSEQVVSEEEYQKLFGK